MTFGNLVSLEGQIIFTKLINEEKKIREYAPVRIVFDISWNVTNACALNAKARTHRNIILYYWEERLLIVICYKFLPFFSLLFYESSCVFLRLDSRYVFWNRKSIRRHFRKVNVQKTKRAKHRKISIVRKNDWNVKKPLVCVTCSIIA